MIASPAIPQRGMKWGALSVSELESRQEESALPFYEIMRVPTMRAGLYVIPPGQEGDPLPSDEDIVCHVISGGGVFQIDGCDQQIGAGSVVFAKAGVDRRFHSIVEELKILIVFAAEPF